MNEYDKQELIEILQRIDDEVSLVLEGSNQKYDVLIVGGCAFLLSDYTSRTTTEDIDVLAVDSRIRNIVMSYNAVNSQSSAYMDCIPYNFEDRLRVLDIDTRAVRYLAPSLEDLVVMKLYAERKYDLSDITSENTLKAIDWNLLDKLVYDEDEARGSALSQKSYLEMTGAYRRYKEKWKK